MTVPALSASFCLQQSIDSQTVGALYYAVQVTLVLDSNRLSVILIRRRIRPTLCRRKTVQTATVEFAVDLASCSDRVKPIVAVSAAVFCAFQTIKFNLEEATIGPEGQ